MSLALSICLFHLLNTTFILLLLTPACNSATVIVSLTCIYASLYSHKADFNIEVLNLIWLFMLFVPHESSLFSLNLDGSFGVLSNKFVIFVVPLLYYYVDLRSSIIFCLFSFLYFSREAHLNEAHFHHFHFELSYF